MIHDDVYSLFSFRNNNRQITWYVESILNLHLLYHFLFIIPKLLRGVYGILRGGGGSSVKKINDLINCVFYHLLV